MRTKHRRFWVSVVAAAIVVAGCASTKFKTVWMDETYQENPVKILVIGISDAPATRRLVEDEFVKGLQDRGTDAVAGYTMLPDQPQADMEAILAKATEVRADAVLITKTIGRRTQPAASPFASFEDQFVDTLTNIYDVKSGRMIWTATTETWINDYVSNKGKIRSFVKVIVKELSKQKILKQAVSEIGNRG
jgi:hypothetical protein